MTDGSFYFNCIKKFMNIHAINYTCKGKAPVIRTLQEMVRALIVKKKKKKKKMPPKTPPMRFVN